jgi:hypothetical protein
MCALQKAPDERAANAETHHKELVDLQLIYQTKLVVGIGFPRPIDLDLPVGLAGVHDTISRVRVAAYVCDRSLKFRQAPGS